MRYTQDKDREFLAWTAMLMTYLPASERTT